MSSNIVHASSVPSDTQQHTRNTFLNLAETSASERNPDLMALGERVRACRARKGMTRKALSEKAGVSERHLANLELGEGNVSFLVLLQIAEALQSSMAELVGDFTTMSPEWLQVRALLEGQDKGTLRQMITMMSEFLGSAAIEQPEHHPRIALIGLRGAGKSTLGRMLAEDLEFPFVEISRVIEQFAGCGIAEIQALYGINAYRRYERRALEETIQIYPEAVIATPGGIVSEPATMNLLMTHCTTIWLQAQPGDHMQRVIAQGDLRPMAGNREAMEDLKAILDSRTPHYAQAQYQVDTSIVSVKTAFSRLQSLVRRVLHRD